MIKIALVEDHVVIRRSLALLIGSFPDCTIVIEASDGSDLIDKMAVHPLPDIILLDIGMPGMDGVETAKWLRQNHPKIKIIALTMVDNDLVIARMVKNGASAYILKDCEPKELKAAILQVHKKGHYYNEWMTAKMKSKKDVRVMVNEKEISFLRLVCTGKGYKEIAEEMNVSPRTIDGYRDALFMKLNLSTRVELVVYAIKNRIVVI